MKFDSTTLFCTKWQVNICLLVAVLSASLLVALLAGCSPSETQNSPAPTAVRIVEVRTGPMQESVQYVGTVHSQQEIKILAQVSGSVGALPFAEGAFVKKGRIVAELFAPEIDSRSSRAKAEVAKAKSEMDFVCKNYETDKKLAEVDAISNLALDDSGRRCQSGTAAFHAAQSAYRETMNIGSKTSERAPFAGKILRRYVEPGQNVMPGTPILLFGNDPLETRVMVAEKDILKGIKSDIPVKLRFQDGTTMNAKTTSVSPIAVGVGRLVEIKIALSSDLDIRLTHGMSVDVFFILAQQDSAVSVPFGAVGTGSSSKFIFLVEGSRLAKMEVTTGLKESGWVSIEPAVAPGTKVVVGNLDAINDGIEVYPVEVEGGSI